MDVLLNFRAQSRRLATQQVHPAIGIQNPQPLQQVVELASIPIQLFVIEPPRDLAPIPLRDRWARAVAPENVLNLVACSGIGRMTYQQLACNCRQVRVCDRLEAGGHALALGTIGGRRRQPKFFAKRRQHGMGAGVFQSRDERLQQCAKLRVVHQA